MCPDSLFKITVHYAEGLIRPNMECVFYVLAQDPGAALQKIHKLHMQDRYELEYLGQLT